MTQLSADEAEAFSFDSTLRDGSAPKTWADVSDQQLLIKLFELDKAVSYGDTDPTPEDISLENQVYLELNRRHGSEACERLANYAVTSHASADDMITAAQNEPAVLVAIMVES